MWAPFHWCCIASIIIFVLLPASAVARWDVSNDVSDLSVSNDQQEVEVSSFTVQNANILCEIRILDVDFPDASNHSDAHKDEVVVCISSSTTVSNVSQTYEIELPREYSWSNGDMVMLQGPLTIDFERARLIPSNVTDWVTMSRPLDAKGHNRQLRSASNLRLTLVVRVTYRGRQPTLTASELQGRIFGRGPDKLINSLRSQLEACSHGKYLVRIPRHDEIENGLMEVLVSQSLPPSEDSVLVLENRVMRVVTARLGEAWMSRLSHILLVFPQHNDIRFNGNPDYLAYGYVGGRISVYRNTWAGKLSALVHEVGHNLFLSHSGMGRDMYADMSGYMGYGQEKVGAPRMCFNGQKHYSLGWYADRTRHLFVQDLPFSGWLAFFLDAPQTQPNEAVITILTLPGPERLFLQYNLAQGANAGTSAGRNAVTIVRDSASIGETRGLQSWWVGKVLPGGRALRYYVPALRGNLVFRACRSYTGPPAKVHIIIHLDRGDGQSAPQCNVTPLPYCDDDMEASFQYNGRARDCGWLMRNLHIPTIRQDICEDVTHDGHRACPETCGACRDECYDRKDASFWVNANLGRKNCEWLSSRRLWQESICVPGHEAFRLCAESCDRCD